MRKITGLLLLIVVFPLAVYSCGQDLSSSPTSIPSTITIESPTQPQVSQRVTLVVTNTADDGRGTLRQALLDAQRDDIITFDSSVFPPKNPVTIQLLSGLPPISQGYLTLDASDAGVILDGSLTGNEWTPGIELTSDHNAIFGLQVVGFSGAGILIDASFNIIGGDRNVGSGMLGRGNLFSDSSDGIIIRGSDNQIIGNMIGTDISGTKNMGNRAPGIAVEGSASRNIIGPNNTIAYNGIEGGCGVEIRSENAQGNVITQNSIHDNLSADLCYNETSTFTSPPVILNFDIETGFVEGISCPLCIVEIFSTSSTDGEAFEGQVIADDHGYYSLSKGVKFSGPNLTATSHSPGKNTSGFSVPASGTSRYVILQEGNDLPMFLLETKTSSQLGDNRIGSQWDWGGVKTGRDIMDVVDSTILPAGLKRVQMTVNGKDTGTANWDKPEFSINSEDDLVFTRLAENGIKITYVLTFWDKETYPYGEGAPCTRFTTEKEIQRYLEYVHFIVGHFKGRVQYFEIWNEPDNGWLGTGIGYDGCNLANIAIDDYINLVRRTIPVIHEEYPDAKITVGSTMPQVESGSREYLFRILTSDIMPFVDVVAWHPGGGSPEYEYWREYYQIYPTLVQEIKDVAIANGFEGEFTADEMGWATETNKDVHWSYSDKRAAKYYARFTLLHLGMDVTFLPGVDGPGSGRDASFNVIRNLCTIMEEAQTINLPVNIETEATDIMSYAFELSNGDKLFAIWTHGAASDDDPSISATLTFPNLSAGEVIGIDVLYGYEQQIIAETEDGNLVVRDLLVKDYPIILHFKDTLHP